MKKLLILSAMCMAMTAQATVLRVSNVTNSGAPYATIPAAIAAAVEGDTIMVDGSPDAYSENTGGYGAYVIINKRLVLMGPGYLLTQNGVQSNGDQPATISAPLRVTADGAGSIIQGFNLTSDNALDIVGSNAVVTRCKIGCNVWVGTDATNFVLHQNLISGVVGRSNYNNYIAYNAQVTNNIFMTPNNSTSGILNGYNESTIAYNIFAKRPQADDCVPLNKLAGCTIEHNIFFGSELALDNNTLLDNYWGSGDSPYQELTTDLEMKNADLGEQKDAMAGKGAFNGDDPYVISGIPAGPVIQDITVPATVEQGGTLNVTIKLGIQK